MKKIITVFILLNCLSAKLFSQQQPDIFLPENVQMGTLLDSTVTASFGNNAYMDIWERIWVKSNQNLTCIDFMRDSLEINYITLDGQSKINDICWLGNGNMFIANDSALLSLDSTGYRVIYYLPYPKMKIAAAANTDSIYIFGFSPKKKEYDISVVSVTGQITRLFSLKDQVKGVAGNGNISIVVLSKELLLFSKKVKPTVFYRANSEIRSIAVTDFGGIFIATQKGITYLENMKKAYTFSNVGAKKLWNINDKLYALFDDGTFAVIYPISQFENFTQNIRQKQNK